MPAEQGHLSAQFDLGTIYHKGKGVPQNYAEAAKWYRKAAEQGEIAAQFYVGWMYKHGEGVPQDDAEALKWYRMAAAQGEIAAQFNMGWMYYDGEGIPQDYLEAHKWFNLAASRSTGEDVEKHGEARELVAKKMTPDQVAEAQRLAREWEPKTWEEFEPASCR